jgi:hypothetical protein
MQLCEKAPSTHDHALSSRKKAKQSDFQRKIFQKRNLWLMIENLENGPTFV